MRLPANLDNLDGLKPNGSGWIARCPVHDDNNPSLSITVTDAGKVLAHCHAGCDQLAVADALGIRGDSNPSTAEWTPHGDATAVYHYIDENGELLFDVLRTADKQFPARRPDPVAKSGWRWSLGDTRRVIYRLPEIITAVSEGRGVCIAEGEKDVEALRAHGRVATCNPGGAGKWKPEYSKHFTDASVTIFADKDKTGQNHARQVAASLEGIARTVWIVEAADPHKDIAAHLGAGLDLNQVTITHRPTERVEPDLAPDIYDILEENEPEYDWLVPGLLERGERFMLTGLEGLGKTMFMRMLAVCFAAGIHPVTYQEFNPLRVLYIDCENTNRQNRRAYAPIIQQAARMSAVPRGNLRLIRRPEGVNLPAEDDRAWLIERVTAHKPDVLFIGPLYRLHYDNPNDEATARAVVRALDDARIQADCAVMIEAHAGHGEWGKNRSVRPVGSSLYLRWPEYGFGIKPHDGQDEKEGRPNMIEMKPWRGARDEREWPKSWVFGSLRGLGFPWVPLEHQTLVPGLSAPLDAAAS
jgi:5S rRNA maturation endonuclease (ribonuclease M5)